MTTGTITSTTPVSHTSAATTVKVTVTGPFNGARLRVSEVDTSVSPNVTQLIPEKDGGIIKEPRAITYHVASGNKLVLTAQDVGSPVPAILYTILDA